MFFFYTVVGQAYGHVIADCFDVPFVVYDGGAQAMYLDKNGKACSHILHFAYMDGKAIRGVRRHENG
jgi:hypothetical protein